MQRDPAFTLRDGLIHCPHCRLSIPAGVMECGFCGRALSGPDSEVERPQLTWTERLYFVCSVLLILQGVLWMIEAFTLASGSLALIVSCPGAIGVVAGIVLFRMDPWAQWFCRFTGPVLVLVSGYLAAPGPNLYMRPDDYFLSLTCCFIFTFWTVFSIVLWKLRD